MSTNTCRNCSTRRQCLAAGLGDDALEALAACVAPGLPLHRGDVLYHAGERATVAYVVRSGMFKTVLLSSDGIEHVVGFHLPGELIGLSGQSVGRHTENAVALETSTACRVRLADFPDLWRIGCGETMLRLVGNGERLAQLGHANLSRHAADARVAGFLVEFGRRLQALGRTSGYLPLPMSRTDLSDHLGMTLECLSRVLARFTREGLVSPIRTGITCHDAARLAAMAGHIDHSPSEHPRRTSGLPCSKAVTSTPN